MRDLLEEVELADELGLDVFAHRRAPPARLPRLRAGRRARRGRRAHGADPAVERRHRAELRRPGARLPAVRRRVDLHLRRPRRDHGRARLVHRVLPAVRLRPRRLRRAVSPRSSSCCSRIRDDVRVTWSGRHRAPLDERRRLAAAGAGSAAGLGRGRRHRRSRSSAPATLGLPLTIAIIGGQPERFVPLVELYRRGARRGRPRPADAAGRDQHARVRRRDRRAGATPRSPRPTWR